MLGAEKAYRAHASRHQTLDHVDELSVHAGGMAEYAHTPAPAQIESFTAKKVETRSDRHECLQDPSPDCSPQRS
jgi:hypothetical protein